MVARTISFKQTHTVAQYDGNQVDDDLVQQGGLEAPLHHACPHKYNVLLTGRPISLLDRTRDSVCYEGVGQRTVWDALRRRMSYDEEWQWAPGRWLVF